MKKKFLYSTLSMMLTYGVLLSPVHAQESVALEEVVVTGSRIPMNPNIESSSPVTQVSADEFLYTGVTRVEDLLNDLPQVTGSNVANDSNGATGTSSVNLRDLGPKRTLVLMNGRRLPTGSPISGGDDGVGADLNFIPSALVKRVEVLTGGSSATYGSDAIAGVVNFIMEDNFDGLRLDVQGSMYQHKNDHSVMQDRVNAAGYALPDSTVWDGESLSASVVWGKNFADDRGNFTAYLNYRDTEAVTQSERDYSACALFGKGDEAFCGGSSTIPQGRFTDFGILSPNSFDYMVQGNQFVPRAGTLYNYAPQNYFQRPDERVSAGFITHYDISDSLTAYAEFGYMRNETLAQIAPSGAFFVTNSLPCGNPLLSDQQRSLICGNLGLSDADTQTVFIGRRNVEGGFRADDLQHEQTRAVFGLKGQLNDTWSFDASLNLSKVELDQLYMNDLSITKIQRALDVVADANGNAVCRSVLNGSDPACVPWNIFQEGGVTQQATDYLVLPLRANGHTKLTNMVAYVTGDLGDYNIKLGNDVSSGVQVVAGLEYRKEELDYNPDANYQSGDGAGQGGPTVGVEGDFAVKELFFEASSPLFTDIVNLNLGYRYSDYDTDKTTDTYKAALDIQAVPDVLKLRASYQAATRHANIRELFRPQSITLFSSAKDPCAGSAPTASFAQCANSGVTAAQYGNIAASPANQYNQLSGGNPNLDPEDSVTQSLGMVLTPMDSLDITIDYFNIDVEGAIGTPGAQYTLDQCVFSNQFCDRVNRGALSGTLWVGGDNIVNILANIGYIEREGFDVALNYSFDVGSGSMSFNYIAAFVTKNDRQPVENSPVIDCNGKWGSECDEPNPKYRHTMRLTWHSNSNITTSVAWRHMGGVEEETTDSIRDDFGSQNYLDVSAIWNVNDSLALRFGINNLFDRDPPISSNGANGNVEVTEYDVLGRYIFLGATYDL